MANGQGTDPLTQFLEQQMRFQEFIQQQQQFGAQQAIAQRQLENAEISSFVELAQNVQRPAELDALAEFFAGRNPEMAETFEQLRTNIAPTLQVQLAGAAGRGLDAMPDAQRAAVESGAAMQAFTGQTAGGFAIDQVVSQLSPSAMQSAVAISQGRELSAAEEQQLELETQRLGLSRQQLNESIRQFGIQAALEGRSLDQQMVLGRLNAVTSAGMLPLDVMGEQGRMYQETQRRLRALEPGTPEAGELLQELVNLRTSSQEVRRLWESQFGNKEAGGLTLNALMDARLSAERNVAGAATPGEQQASIEMQNLITDLLEAATGQPLSRLTRPSNSWLPFRPEIAPIQPPR